MIKDMREELKILEAFKLAGAVLETDRENPGDEFLKFGQVVPSQPRLIGRVKNSLRPHFLLSSGRHTRIFFQVSLALRYAQISEMVAERIYKFLERRELLSEIDVLIGPPMGALPVIYALQHLIHSPKIEAMYPERDRLDNFVLARGFDLKEKNVLFVDDVFTTGRALAKLRIACEKYAISRECAYNPLGAAFVIDRSHGGSLPLEVRAPALTIVSALRVPVEDCDESECESCEDGHPLIRI